MQVDALMVDAGPSIYYDSAFRNVLEDHMTYLREHPQTMQLAVEPTQAYRFEADLFGLLSYYNVPVQFQWIVMRMNKMTSPTDAHPEITLLLVPDHNVIEHIQQSHKTKRRIT